MSCHLIQCYPTAYSVLHRPQTTLDHPRSITTLSPITSSHSQSHSITPNHTTCICLLPSAATTFHAYTHTYIHTYHIPTNTPPTTHRLTPIHPIHPIPPPPPPIPPLSSTPVPFPSRPYEPAARPSALQLSAMHYNPNSPSPSPVARKARPPSLSTNPISPISPI